MTTADITRNKLIDKLLAISNPKVLEALFHIVDRYSAKNSVIELTAAEKKVLELSHQDYLAGNYLSHEQLEQEDAAWLNQK